MCRGVDYARARPQREQRHLPALQRLRADVITGQDHQDVGGRHRLLRTDIHRTQVYQGSQTYQPKMLNLENYANKVLSKCRYATVLGVCINTMTTTF